MQLVTHSEHERRIETLCRTARRTQPFVPPGIHHVLELYDCPAAVLNDASLLSEAIEQAGAVAKTKLLNKLVHSFPTQGVTALALLAESHIAVHTWPELGYAAVDLFACGERARPEAGCAYLIQTLQARRYSLRKLWRGQAGTPVLMDPLRETRTTSLEGAFSQ